MIFKRHTKISLLLYGLILIMGFASLLSFKNPSIGVFSKVVENRKSSSFYLKRKNFLDECMRKNTVDTCETVDKISLSITKGLTIVFLPFYYLPPASFSTTLKESLAKIGVLPKSYAQGYGVEVFSPFLPLWKSSLIFSFTIFALVNVVIGLMMILNVNWSQQVVVKLENALPRILVTMILIYFSYAIVGLVFDFMVVVSYILLSFLGIMGKGSRVVSVADAPKFLGLYWSDLYTLTNSIAGNIYTQVGRIIQNFILKAFHYAPGAATILLLQTFFTLYEAAMSLFRGLENIEIAAESTGKLIPWMISFALATVFLFVIGALLAFIIGSFATLYFLGRFLFLALRAYISIVINLIFAPILLLPNAIPGNESFSNWLKSLVADMLVFPLLLFFVGLSYIIFLMPDFKIIGFPILEMESVGVTSSGWLARVGLAAGILLLTPSLIESVTSRLRKLKLFGPIDVTEPVVSVQRSASGITAVVDPFGRAISTLGTRLQQQPSGKK